MINKFCKSHLYECTQELASVAMGRLNAELVIKGAKLVNVCTKEIIDDIDVAVYQGRIAKVGKCDDTIGKKTKVIDAKGLYLAPAFMDGHMHIESSMLTPKEYAKAVLPHGTSAVYMDPHEICNVLGLKGVRCMLDDSKTTPLKVMLTTPSCVPAVPGFEDTGSFVGPDDVRGTMAWDECVGLGEMMNFPGIINSNDETHKIVLKSGEYSLTETLAPKGAEIDTPIPDVKLTGHYDIDGLREIGYGDEELEWYEETGTNWDEESDSEFLLTTKDKSMYGLGENDFLQLNSSYNKLQFEVTYMPKFNLTKTNLTYGFNYYYSLKTIPLLNTINVNNMSYMFNFCYALVTIPRLNTSNVTNFSNMFNKCYSLKEIPQLNMSKATNTSYMFASCYSLKTIPQLDVSKVTIANNMFNDCRSLKTIPLLNFESCDSLSSLFSNCYSLKTIPQLDTSKMLNFSYMFQNCYSLTKIPQLNTSLATNFSNMFNGCYSLKEIPQLDISKATTTTAMFQNCYSLATLPKLDTKKVTDASNMFYLCYSLKYIPELDFSRVTLLSSTFSNCSTLKSVSLLTSDKLTSLRQAFSGCYALKTVSISDTSMVNDMYYAFQNCYALAAMPKINTSEVTNFSSSFYNCFSLNYVPTLNLSKATNVSSAFQNCYALKFVEQLNVNNATNLNSLFNTCYSLIKIDKIVSEKAIYMDSAFRYCYQLASVDLSSIDLTKVTSFSNMFQSCGAKSKASDGAYANGITTVYVKDADSQNWVLTKSNGRPSSWTTANVIIAGSAQDLRGSN